MRTIYDLLASVYDQPDHQEVTNSFYAAIEPHVRARPDDTWLLDLGCGTGVLARKLAKIGCPVLGIDISAGMLAIARDRCRGCGDRVQFRRADLENFEVKVPASIASASGDIMNHFLSTAMLRRIFRQIYRNLEPGGLLIFDALNRFCYEHYWHDRDYVMESPEGDLAMICDWNPERRLATARMIGYVRDKGRNYKRIETTLVEKWHTNQEMRQALRAAGFERIRGEPWSPWEDQHLEPALDRNLWTAYRPLRS